MNFEHVSLQQEPQAGRPTYATAGYNPTMNQDQFTIIAKITDQNERMAEQMERITDGPFSI